MTVNNESGAGQPAAQIGDTPAAVGADGVHFFELPFTSLTVEQFVSALAMHAVLVNPRAGECSLEAQASRNFAEILKFAERDWRYRDAADGDGAIKWRVDPATGCNAPYRLPRDFTLSDRRGASNAE